jgi:sodium-dependent dicarboxylate transporter 2/3/5
MICLSDFGAAGAVLQQAFGNPVVVQMFFLMIFMQGLTDRKLTIYIARWIMTRKFIEGKPWMFTFAMLFGSYIMSVFIGAFAPIFLFWPVLYGVFADVGYKPGDKYPTIMLIAIVIAVLLGFPVPPYMANGLALLGNFRGLLANFPALAGTTISNASYFLACIINGAVEVLLVVGLMKYVLKPDVEPLKQVTIEKLNKNPLPPMNEGQKIYFGFLIAFVVCMLFPSLLPTWPILSFLNTNSFVVGIILVTIGIALKVEDGPVLNIGRVMGGLSWPTYYLCVVAILIGSVLTAQTTGITPFLNTILSPIFKGMSGGVFAIVLVIATVLLTNISNSLVIGMILQPVVLTYCATSGVNPAPLITLLIFTVLSTAACTPAASPFAAMMFGNTEWLKSGQIYKNSIIFVVVQLAIILTLGVAYINILM